MDEEDIQISPENLDHGHEFQYREPGRRGRPPFRRLDGTKFQPSGVTTDYVKFTSKAFKISRALNEGILDYCRCYGISTTAFMRIAIQQYAKFVGIKYDEFKYDRHNRMETEYQRTFEKRPEDPGSWTSDD